MSKRTKDLTRDLVTCLKCNWVHFQVSRKYAVNQVKEFNEYYKALPRKKQIDYYGGKGSNISQYEHCFYCGGSYTNFRDSVDGDCPDGCTIQPIMDRND